MAAVEVPSKMKQLVAVKHGLNFREVTQIVEVDVPTPGPKEVLTRNKFLGINASDVNFTYGRFFSSDKFPFTVGFECMGEVVQTGPDATLKIGQPLMVVKIGCFQEYTVIPESEVITCPSLDPEYLTMLASGTTALLALEKEGDLKPGQTVLVTAAAGGTGHFAVQLAKLAGCHVIGTCSSEEKVQCLKSLGCDRVVNYKCEDIDQVLSTEYPKGLDVVYECVGNEMLDAALRNVADFGRILVIGFISCYKSEIPNPRSPMDIKDEHKESILMTCLSKNVSMRGFFLGSYLPELAPTVNKLVRLYTEGKLKTVTDRGDNETNGPFLGMNAVPDAVEYLYSKKSLGKIVVELATDDRK